MEHLPLPKGAELNENDIVPYIASTDYIGVPFLSYPQVKGFHHIVPRPGSVNFAQYESHHPTPDDKIASFLQTWLFFGMLQEAFGSLYQHDDFVRNYEDNDGLIQVLTTAKLPLRLDERFSASPTSEIDQKSLVAHFHECMDLATEALPVVASRLSRKAAFSISATLEALCSTLNSNSNLYLTNDFGFSLTWLSSIPRTYWIEQMSLNGWCARECSIATKEFLSVQALHYLSKMKKSYRGDEHRNCTKDECSGMQIDLANYKPRHCQSLCTCAIVSVDIERLNSILENGKFPLLRLRGMDSTDEPKIELIESTGDTCYVALSHVWADGLGNPFANALPRCQLSGLEILAQEVLKTSGDDSEKPALLWLDTLCVPYNSGPGKNMAMSMMRKTYQEAHHVLVLESSLRCCHAETSDLVEAAVRIFTSPWLRRLWTLQEGALAGRLWFQFQNRPVELAEIFQAMGKEIQSRNYSNKEIAFDVMANHRLLRLYSPGQPITLPILLRSLQHRGVSVASDEPICLANLFDIDTSILAGLEGSPMAHLWRTLCKSMRIPRSIIFFEGAKMNEKGFQWAPSRLLGAKNQLPFIDRDHGVPATFNSEGLVVQFPGILVSRPFIDLIPLVFNKRKGLPDLWHLFDSGDKWYEMAIKNTNVQTCIFGERDDTPSQVKMLENPSAFGIIFSHDPNIPQRKPTRQPHALFVSLKRYDDGMYNAHIEGEVLLLSPKSGECLIYSRAMEIAKKLPRKEVVATLLQLKDMEDDKKNKTVTSIFETLLAETTQAAEEALNDPTFKSVYDLNYPPDSALFVAQIWLMYTQRLILVNKWLPDDTLWCLD